MFAKYFSRFILWLIGWEIDIRVPADKKYIVIIAPHTSNRDFIIGRLANWACEQDLKFMIKKEAFTFFMGPILRMLGGVPIDRSRSIKVVDQMINSFKEKERFVLAITPEGTRKKTTRWKTGFYRIAVQAGVPIYLGYLDYGKKHGGMVQRFDPTGNMEEDMKAIKAYYKDMQGYYKDQFAI